MPSIAQTVVFSSFDEFHVNLSGMMWFTEWNWKKRMWISGRAYPLSWCSGMEDGSTIVTYQHQDSSTWWWPLNSLVTVVSQLYLWCHLLLMKQLWFWSKQGLAKQCPPLFSALGLGGGGGVKAGGHLPGYADYLNLNFSLGDFWVAFAS